MHQNVHFQTTIGRSGTSSGDRGEGQGPRMPPVGEACPTRQGKIPFRTGAYVEKVHIKVQASIRI